MFGWFKRNRLSNPEPTEPQVPVFLNPLFVLLAARERQKGSPLNEHEVLEVRDTALCTPMPISRAKKFYENLHARFPEVPCLNPENVWEEWQAIRDQVEW